MLTQDILRELKHYRSMHRSGAIHRYIAYSTVRGMLKKGQLLYRFNRDNSGLDTYVFVSWFSTLSEGGMSGVLSRGTGNHHNDLHVDNYIVRDILLSVIGDYDSECFFIDEKLAKGKLKVYLRKKLEKNLKDLEEKKS